MRRNVRKCTFGHKRSATPANTQCCNDVFASLFVCWVRVVGLQSSPGALWLAKDARFLHADNADSDHTARMYKLIWVFVRSTPQEVCLLPLQFFSVCFKYLGRNENNRGLRESREGRYVQTNHKYNTNERIKPCRLTPPWHLYTPSKYSNEIYTGPL